MGAHLEAGAARERLVGSARRPAHGAGSVCGGNIADRDDSTLGFERGQSATTGYRRFQEEGEAFKPGYLRLLSYGGSARPENILAEVGIDMTDRQFWQGGFDFVRERIDELESMKL